jgi:hypothetical protein
MASLSLVSAFLGSLPRTLLLIQRTASAISLPLCWAAAIIRMLIRLKETALVPVPGWIPILTISSYWIGSQHGNQNGRMGGRVRQRIRAHNDLAGDRYVTICRDTAMELRQVATSGAACAVKNAREAAKSSCQGDLRGRTRSVEDGTQVKAGH